MRRKQKVMPNRPIRIEKPKKEAECEIELKESRGRRRITFKGNCSREQISILKEQQNKSSDD